MTPERIVLDAGGVGYEVAVPLSTYTEVAQAGGLGATVALHVYTHLWSDGIALYGFWTPREKRLFERLIAVSGIGPRLARVVLSGMAPGDLVAALAAGDVGRLSTIPGIGKKTAERMVVELKDRMAELAAEEPVTAGTPTAPGDRDLVSALVNLGYKATHAERAVRDARQETPGGEFHELLRASLKRLARG